MAKKKTAKKLRKKTAKKVAKRKPRKVSSRTRKIVHRSELDRLQKKISKKRQAKKRSDGTERRAADGRGGWKRTRESKHLRRILVVRDWLQGGVPDGEIKVRVRSWWNRGSYSAAKYIRLARVMIQHLSEKSPDELREDCGQDLLRIARMSGDDKAVIAARKAFAKLYGLNLQVQKHEVHIDADVQAGRELARKLSEGEDPGRARELLIELDRLQRANPKGSTNGSGNRLPG